MNSEGPTEGSAAMTFVRIYLIDVLCRDTEDITGADTFYMSGGVVAPGVNKAVLTTPIWINTTQTKNFRDDERVLFEGNVVPGSSVGVVFVAWDEDAAKDYAKNKEWIQRLQKSVDAAATTATVVGTAESHDNSASLETTLLTIAAATMKFVTFGMKADLDDNLGTHKETLKIGSTPSSSVRTAAFRSSTLRNKLRVSSWDYVVRYAVDQLPELDSGGPLGVGTTDLVLTARPDGTVVADHDSGAPEQRWVVQMHPKAGSYLIISAANRRALTLAGDRVLLAPYNGEETQGWYAGDFIGRPMAVLRNRVNRTSALSIEPTVGALLQMRPANRDDKQQHLQVARWWDSSFSPGFSEDS